MFLQAFEKPTQIYRFLRTRNQIAPIFMHRTLTYMRKRNTRCNKNRLNFNVNSMLLREENKQKTLSKPKSIKSDYMNLSFQEFHMPTNSDNQNNIEPQSNQPATIEAVLLKICHKKRKDVYTPVLRDSLGQCTILPSSTGRLPHSPSICIPSSKLSHTNGHTIKSYILLVKVVCPVLEVRPVMGPDGDAGMCNGETEGQEPPVKRTRRNSGRTPEKEPGNQTSETTTSSTVSYASELVILDKHQKCHLTDGDYEVSLQEVRSKVKNGSKGSSWETLMDGKAVASLEELNSGPLLKFHLEWATKPITQTSTSPQPTSTPPQPTSTPTPSTATSPAHVSSPSSPRAASSGGGLSSPRSPRSRSPRGGASSVSLPSPQKMENGVEEVMDTSTTPSSPRGTSSPQGVTSPEGKGTAAEALSPSKHALRAHASPPPGSTPTRNAATSTITTTSKLRVFYQFLYNNNTRQQTEARDNLHCPWCALNCQELYGLMKHLTLCHSRFKFTYVPLPKGARIDVSINEHYDGSYAGNPQNLTSHTGYAFRRNGPCRRTPVTQILVITPRRSKHYALTEFQEGEEKESLGTRPYISGHNRIYYHTHSLQAMRPQEMDYDSEDEVDPPWLQERTNVMIDEFTDVNEGEKELMKIWNLFCMKQNYITDAHIPLACLQFVQERGEEILENNLKNNLALHLVNLYDFSLIHPTVIVRSMAELDKIEKQMASGGVGEDTTGQVTITTSAAAVMADIPAATVSDWGETTSEGTIEDDKMVVEEEGSEKQPIAVTEGVKTWVEESCSSTTTTSESVATTMTLVDVETSSASTSADSPNV